MLLTMSLLAGVLLGGCGSGDGQTDVKAIQQEAASQVPKGIGTPDPAVVSQGRMGSPQKGGK